ncbi:hypothetical protein [Mucilaginibacter antarcticus]|uniref:hypothetical protein n=1 Tax=Mucilaginibacter antarcticus TaxID=1855725 RepID=UPI00362AE030
MDILPQFESIFEPALMKEIQEFGVLKPFKEGDIIMDYGRYIKMMPLVIRGSLKVLKKMSVVKRSCCITFPAVKVVLWLIAVALRPKK